MTHEELSDILKTLPAVEGRGGRSKDVPEVQAISRACGVVLDERRFRELLRGYSAQIVILWVTECKQTRAIRGYVLYELKSDATGDRILKVLDMAAGDPVARRDLLAEMEAKAKQQRRALVWATPSY